MGKKTLKNIKVKKLSKRIVQKRQILVLLKLITMGFESRISWCWMQPIFAIKKNVLLYH